MNEFCQVDDEFRLLKFHPSMQIKELTSWKEIKTMDTCESCQKTG